MQKHLAVNYLVALVGALNMVYNGLYSSFQVMTSWVDYFHNPSPYWIGMINTAPGIVSTVYAFFIAPIINDWLGRRRSIFAAGFVNITGAFVMTFAPNVAAFMVGKAIISVSISQGSNSGPLLISELALPSIRGRLISFWQMFWSFGAILAAYVCLGTSYSPGLGNWQWKIPSILQIFTPTLICICVCFVPESPRWLVSKGRSEEARRALCRVRLEEDVDEELKEIQGAVLYESEYTKGKYKQWFVNKSYFRRLVLVFGLYLGQQLGGQGVLTQYSGIVYQSVFSDPKTIILLNGLNWALAVLYVLPATFFIDKIGRKPLLLAGAIVQGVAMLGAATVVTQSPKINGNYSFGTGVAAVTFVFFFNLGYQSSWGCATWVVATEVFPLNVRAQGLAISGTVEGAVMTALGVAFPIFLSNTGFYAFYFFMAVNFIDFVWVYIFLPETKGRSLEEMDHLFGGVDHGAAGRAIAAEKAMDGKDPFEERIEYAG